MQVFACKDMQLLVAGQIFLMQDRMTFAAAASSSRLRGLVYTKDLLSCQPQLLP